MRRTLALVATAAMLTGCASETNRALLALDHERCGAGDADACRAEVLQAAINRDEANANALEIVAVGLLGPLIVAGAVAAARGPAPPPFLPPPPFRP